MDISGNKLRNMGLMLALGGCLASPSGFAASKLYSSVSTVAPSEAQTSKQVRSQFSALSSAFVASSASSTSVFNLSISLEENPQGDDDYSADSGAGDDAQNKFERKIEEFADAVFQMTNGAHKIGKVTVFRNSDQANNADVQWKKDCASDQGPRANVSGFGVPGMRIWMCTNWSGAPSLMDTPKGAGFTLAHEWAHYAYGVMDEYASNCGEAPESKCWIGKPRSTDTESSPSIMNNQWNAALAGGDQDWLEFSTVGVQPYATRPDGDDENAQARVYGEPAWQTLTRSTDTDPKLSWLNRTQYSNLAAPGPADLTVNDDEATARDQLDIVWAGNQVVELMIDTSGSMRGLAIDNAKAAADLLVGQLTPGESAIGVGRFNSGASQIYPITDIPDPDTAVIAAAQTAISNLRAGGGTDIEEAALLGLSQTQAFESGSRPSVVFLLTDGKSTVNIDTVVNQYNAANVPLITFGFGSRVDTDLLQSLASGTGGQYFFSPTSLASIQQAFVAANAAVSSSVVVDSSSLAATNSAVSARSVEVDSSMGRALFNVTHAGNDGDIDFRLLDPSGSDTGLMFDCTGTRGISCNVEVDVSVFGAGTYTIEASNTTSGDLDVSVLVSGSPAEFESYELAVEFGSINYPESFSIYATVTKGPAIAGLDVVAEVTSPNGSKAQITLLDDGRNSDAIANDGIYSAAVAYESGFSGNGTYTAVVSASNSSRSAYSTYRNVAISLSEDGSNITPSSVSITENFSRTGIATASVSNSIADDHGNDVQGGACTPIADDNVDTVGRIDAPADVDCFSFLPTDTSSDLVVRLTALTSDIAPVLKVYNADGSSEVLSATISDTENADSGLIVTLPSGSLDALGHLISVEHADDTASKGGYEVSVGRALVSDTPPVDRTGKVLSDNDSRSDSSGGGSVSIWSLLSLMLLAVFGARPRYLKRN